MMAVMLTAFFAISEQMVGERAGLVLGLDEELSDARHEDSSGQCSVASR